MKSAKSPKADNHNLVWKLVIPAMPAIANVIVVKILTQIWPYKSLCSQRLPISIPQEASQILDTLALTPFEQCHSINRKFANFPSCPGLYAIRHRNVQIPPES